MPGACPICELPLREVFRAEVLNRHKAIYDHCDACGFLRVRAPHWLDEAYSDAIAITDTGLMARNQTIARQLASVCGVLEREPGETYLDVAGGYGVLTRLMRDAGFDFYWSDPFCQNLMASGFAYTADRGPCRLVTAFEVFEHVEDPRDFVTGTLAAGSADTLVFTTELYAGAPPRPADWWYYSFETGQHVAFYRRDTLACLADKLGLYFHTSSGLHFLSRNELPVRRIDHALSRTGLLLARVTRRKRTGLTWADHKAMVEKLVHQARDGGARV